MNFDAIIQLFPLGCCHSSQDRCPDLIIWFHASSFDYQQFCWSEMSSVPTYTMCRSHRQIQASWGNSLGSVFWNLLGIIRPISRMFFTIACSQSDSIVVHICNVHWQHYNSGMVDTFYFFFVLLLFLLELACFVEFCISIIQWVGCNKSTLFQAPFTRLIDCWALSWATTHSRLHKSSTICLIPFNELIDLVIIFLAYWPPNQCLYFIACPIQSVVHYQVELIVNGQI